MKGHTMATAKTIRDSSLAAGAPAHNRPQGCVHASALVRTGFRRASLAVAVLIASLAAAQGAASVPVHDGLDAGSGPGREEAAPVPETNADRPESSGGTVLAFDARQTWQSIRRKLALLARRNSADPDVRVRMERGSYRFFEGERGKGVAVVAETVMGGPPPRRFISLMLATKARADGAANGQDFKPWSRLFRLHPADFHRDGKVWRARKEFPLAIVDDAETEGPEVLDITLYPYTELPEWITLLRADGEVPCEPRGCIVPVTIVDDDAAPATPVAPGVHGNVDAMDDASAAIDSVRPVSWAVVSGRARVSAEPGLPIDGQGPARPAIYVPMSRQPQDTRGWATLRLVANNGIERQAPGHAPAAGPVGMDDKVLLSSIKSDADRVVEEATRSSP